ncbi:isoprenoid biosynthesis protein with amidotransferase-like domain [Oceanimonas sp. GK1]|uniref:isoprenoid biosynthesis glyoxalase ElbB n=1 Tax=Oceanimonas sp. (strain GK1 / IBRC-M 10197) TaxID=511062 RepID=UPI0002494CCC|nr:isoprenoid biosynthesis glyoxalase ElbB [Oceanimonas sp. GK1]AEY00257.1 isoprenoid biosynthesis protein with amidotransferase-like domain [Oceanimonas sp. GK1]
MKKVAVILSGCGVYDGAEIHEAVLCLLHLDRHGARYQCFAPDQPQHHVIDHRTGQESDEQRNMLTEAARIARGDIQPLSALNASDFDALLLPGGFGVAKNLCNFAFEGAECEVDNEVLAACHAFAQARKPAGYCCIAPVLIPRIYPAGVKGTIGTDAATAEAFTAMGGEHIGCAVTDVVEDAHYKVISTPAYMLAQRITEADTGIGKLVKRLLEM